MTPSRDPGFDRRIAEWLEDDPATAPAHVLDVVLAAIPSVAQRRVADGFPWRYLRMTTPIRVAAGLAAALAIAIGSFVILNGMHPTDVGVSPSPASSPASSGPLGSNVGESISPSASHALNGPLDGTSWTTQISAADEPPGVPQIAMGTWTLTFDAFDGSTLMSLGNPRGGGPGYPVTYGPNNEVTFPADPTCAREDGNPTGPSTSTYRFAVTGNSLTFTLVTTDSCTARVVNLTAHPWTKAP